VTRLLAALAVAATLLATLGAGARAQDGPPALEVTLTSISPVVRPRAPLDYRVAVRNRSQAPVRNLVVQARLGQPVDTRSELAALLANPGAAAATRPLDEFPGPAEVAPGAGRQLERRRVAMPPGLADGRAGVVLPLTVRVQGSGVAGPVVASLTTFVVDPPG
jgi:hypothetical protein